MSQEQTPSHLVCFQAIWIYSPSLFLHFKPSSKCPAHLPSCSLCCTKDQHSQTNAHCRRSAGLFGHNSSPFDTICRADSRQKWFCQWELCSLTPWEFKWPLHIRQGKGALSPAMNCQREMSNTTKTLWKQEALSKYQGSGLCIFPHLTQIHHQWLLILTASQLSCSLPIPPSAALHPLLFPHSPQDNFPPSSSFIGLRVPCLEHVTTSPASNLLSWGLFYKKGQC